MGCSRLFRNGGPPTFVFADVTAASGLSGDHGVWADYDNGFRRRWRPGHRRDFLFPNHDKSPEESFAFLENHAGLKFTAHTFPDCYRGRWLTMDSGDLDGDGDADVVLGGVYKTPFRATEALLQRWQKEGPSLLILRNQFAERKREAVPG